jgi:ribosomal protein S27AE
MKAKDEQHWHEVAQEVLLEMNTWREEHPTATMQEIEEEVDKRIARMRARLVEGLAMSSAAAEIGSRASDQPACCPTCGGVLQARGKQVRKLTTTGEQTVRLERSYGYCPRCQVGFFPAFMSNWDCGPKWGSRQR